jgi:nitrite reductase/ring-hydroxylating ferredoxin subunit
VCSHQEAPLSDGYIEDSAVRCPVHQVLFDLRTGEPDGPPARTAVRTHPVKVVDATVYLDVGPIGA